MRNIFNLFIISLLFFSCKSDKKLDTITAQELIKKEKGYPKILEYEIYTADPEEAKKMLDLGLEKSGLLKIQLTQASKDIGEPLITFTDKAKPYLLPQTAADKKSKVQRVKIADEVIKSVTNIDMQEDGKSAVVEYETSFKNINPFLALTSVKVNEKHKLKANFVFDYKGWKLN